MTSPLPDPLLRKYRDLLLKHESLVQRLEAHNNERVSLWTLSNWGLEMLASGLALLQEGKLVMANPAWTQLARQPGGWVQLGSGEKAVPLGLREVAAREARLLLDSGEETSHLTCYQQVGSERLLELHTKHVPRRTRQSRVLVLALDITERMRIQAELNQAQQALIEREHLRSLGEMASGVVHDLSNTLNAMRLRLELIQRDTEFAERQRGHLDALVSIVNDANTRLRQLREFSRQQPESQQGEPVQLDKVVHEAVDIAQAELEHRTAQQGGTLHLDVRLPTLPLVSGSAADLRYVFINLLLNARDAMPRGGTISVHGAHVASQVVLTVADEGTGIREEHLHSIFRPFFTTKGQHGTGLGLSMAYGVVSRMGGTITAANRPEGGALFTLAFPALASPSARPTHTRPKSAGKRAQRRGR